MKKRHQLSRLGMILSLVFFALCGRAHAGIHLWNGSAGDGLWSNAGNWAGGVPTSGENGGTQIYFSSGYTSTMNIANLVVDSIEFGSSGGNTINGSTILGINGNTLTINLQNDGGTNTINAPLKFTSTAAVLAYVKAGSLNLNGNLTSVAGSNGFILDNNIITPTGTGTLTIGGAALNSYTGKTLVAYGMLLLNSSTSTAIPGELDIGQSSGTAGTATVRLLAPIEIADTAPVIVNATGVFDLNGHGETVGALTVNAGGSVTLGGAVTLTVTGAASITDGSIVAFTGTLQLQSTLSMNGGTITATTGTLSLGGDVTAVSSVNSGALISCGSGSLTLNATNRIFTVNSGPTQPELTIHGVIANGAVTPSGLRKEGTGDLDLLSSQTYLYSGTTTVNKGLLRMNTTNGHIINGPLVIGNAADTAGSAIVRELTQSNDIAGTVPVTLNFSGVLDIAGEIDTVASLTGTGSLMLGSSGKFVVGDSTNFAFAGTISGSGIFTKQGAGTMTFNGSTSMSASTVIADGELDLNMSGGSPWLGPLQIGDSTGAANSASLVLFQDGLINSAAQLTLNSDGLLNLNGHTQTLGALTTVGGSVSIGTGTLTVGGTLNMTGGTISASTGMLNLGGNVVGTSSATAGAAITAKLALNATTRSITVTSGAVQPEMVINAIIVDGTVVPSGIFKSGTGTLALLNGGTNTYSGTTTVDKGVITMNSSASVILNGALIIGNNVDPANSATVTELNSSDIGPTTSVQINASGVLNIGTHQDSIDGLSGTGGVLINNGLTAGAGNSTSTFNGTISGTGTFRKGGTGTLTLGGNNSASTTNTIVRAGTLLVNGSLGAAATVSVGDASLPAVTAVLGGTGTVGIAKTVTSGGVIAPGGVTSGTLTCLGGVDLGTAPGTLSIALGGGTHNEIATTQNLNLTGSKLSLVTSSASQNVYLIASYGTLTGTFATTSPLPSGYTLNYAYNDGSGPNHIALTSPVGLNTLPASSVVGTSAHLNGTINSGNTTLSWYFDYGLTTAYGSKTPVVAGLKSTTPKAVTATISGLDGGSTYHVRLVAFNVKGPIFGGDVQFTTTGPVVATGAAASVSALSATVSGAVNPGGLPTTTFFEYGLTTSYGSKTAVQSVGNGSASVPVTAHLTGLSYGKLYHYRIDATNAAGTTRGLDGTFETLTVYPPVITTQPVSKIAALGATVIFNLTAVEGSPVTTDTVQTYQWRKNGAVITGAKSASYVIAAALAQAGTYTCLVSNSAGSVSSGGAELGVVDQTPKTLHLGFGTSTTLTANVAGNGLIYQWVKNSTAIPSAQGKTLPLPALQTTDDGAYHCVVQNVAGSLATGTVSLAVFDKAPVILTPVTMPGGIVGGPYSFQIPVDTTTGDTAPASYIATGLPAGLAVNATSGLISGRITAAVTSASGSDYTVTMKASNTQGSSTTSCVLHVSRFPLGIAGSYSGLVSRDALPPGNPNINGGLGGGLTVTVAATGAYTGKLMLGATSYILTGVVNSTVGSSMVNSTSTITRAVPLHNLILTLSLNGDTGAMTGSVADALIPAVFVTVDGDLNPWNAISHPAALLAATYTSQIKIANSTFVGTATAGNIVYPQGAGYATVTITSAGSVTWIGKMGDGTSPATTYTTTMAQDGSFPVHLSLDAGTGASNGFITAKADTGNTNGGLPLLDGTLDWNKIAAPGSTNRTYKDIPLFNLTVAGGQYVKPLAGVPVLGISAATMMGSSNATLVFTDGGLTSIASMPPVTGTGATLATSLGNLPLRITTGNIADFSPSMGNPAGVTLILNTTTGAMSGTFTLVDSGVTRKVSYFGLLVPRLSVRQGVGYFLLPELPSPTTTPILSGRVILSGT